MIKTIKRSLRQLLGDEYVDSVKKGAMFFNTLPEEKIDKLIDGEINFYPESFKQKGDSLLNKTGTKVLPKMKNTQKGAATYSFFKASDSNLAPINGIGCLRLGEDGRLYLISKSEHYHAPLGHNFPGYKLLEFATRLGIDNATHNNARGYITRLLETELIRTVNGISKDDKKTTKKILESKDDKVLNRVINLQTGSLAAEAGIKMMLARFYRLDKTYEKSKYADRIPVFFVIGDYEGGTTANYHGTTVLAQTLRGMWPEVYNKAQDAGIYKVCPVKINDIDDFKAKMEKYNRPPYKTAGFLHEIILMNYGVIKLEKEYLKQAYEICKSYDTPVMVDEIQSCMWYKGMFLFNLYGLKPDFVIIGKGFPGGRFAGSKIITTEPMDSLNQFGALVTNGQEELTSLAYLITMEFAKENYSHLDKTGKYYEQRLFYLAKKYPELIDNIEGKGHLLGVKFHDINNTVKFANSLKEKCIDISAHTYKASCPPTALTKIPIVSTNKTVDFLVSKMEESLNEI